MDYTKKKIINKDFFQWCGINPENMSLSQRRHVDKLINMFKIFMNDPKLGPKVKGTIIEFIDRTNGLEGKEVFTTYRSVVFQIVKYIKAPRIVRSFKFPIDPELLEQMRIRYQMNLDRYGDERFGKKLGW